MDEISLASAFIASLARLILLAMLAWGVILLCPLEPWAKRVAEIALAIVVVASLIADLTSRRIADVSVPRNVPSITR